MTQRMLSITMLALFVGACSSSQENQELDEYLATNIRSDGSKEFYYTVVLPKPDRSKSASGKNVSGGARISGGSSSNTRAGAGVTIGGGSGGKGRGKGAQQGSRYYGQLVEYLEDELLTTGFCREGWMEQERHFVPPNASIRGECNETASGKDRKNFPNSDDGLG